MLVYVLWLMHVGVLKTDEVKVETDVRIFLASTRLHRFEFTFDAIHLC